MHRLSYPGKRKIIIRWATVPRTLRRSVSWNATKLEFRDVSINHTGFTLIEILVSIAVIAIVAVISGVGLVEISKGYVFSRKNAVIAQQGHIAMARLKKELGNIKMVSSATQTSIAFTRSSDGSSHNISWVSGSSALLIDGDTLIEPVTSFNLAYYDSYNSSASSYGVSTSMIEITLQLVGAENFQMNLIDRIDLYLETGG